MEKYALFFALALFAEIIGTVSGFGSSILFVPLASVFFDFKLVLGITAVFHVFSNISKIFFFRKGIDLGIALKLGVPAVIFVIVGALLSSVIPVEKLELGMSILLVVLALVLILSSGRKLAQTDRNLVAGGVLSGFLAGIIGTGGAIRGLTLAAFDLEKNIFIATSALIDLGVDSSRAVVYYFNGYIVREMLFTIPFLIGISILGTWVGKLILRRISQTVFRYLVLLLIIAVSVAQAIKFFGAG